MAKTQDIINQGYVKTETSNNGIATITFQHPSHNALPGNLLAELANSITTAGQDENIKVIILKSA